MRVRLELQINFGRPMRLIEIGVRRHDFPRRGIYLITERKRAMRKVTPFDRSVVYIGKANKESIFSRCQKHLWSIECACHTSGTPKTRPGKAFKGYREKIGFDPTNLWVVPGEMCDAKPYLISCAEEYLLFEFARLHGRFPLANTTG